MVQPGLVGHDSQLSMPTGGCCSPTEVSSQVLYRIFSPIWLSHDLVDAVIQPDNGPLPIVTLMLGTAAYPSQAFPPAPAFVWWAILSRPARVSQHRWVFLSPKPLSPSSLANLKCSGLFCGKPQNSFFQTRPPLLPQFIPRPASLAHLKYPPRRLGGMSWPAVPCL